MRKTTFKISTTPPQFVVRAADGFEIAPGQIAWRGRLWFGDVPVAAFSNDGNGGCCTWVVCPGQQDVMDVFTAQAKKDHPGMLEAADWAVGLLWDTAMRKRVA